jgi:hypothetical protein
VPIAPAATHPPPSTRSKSISLMPLTAEITLTRLTTMKPRNKRPESAHHPACSPPWLVHLKAAFSPSRALLCHHFSATHARKLSHSTHKPP